MDIVKALNYELIGYCFCLCFPLCVSGGYYYHKIEKKLNENKGVVVVSNIMKKCLYFTFMY